MIDAIVITRNKNGVAVCVYKDGNEKLSANQAELVLFEDPNTYYRTNYREGLTDKIVAAIKPHIEKMDAEYESTFPKAAEEHAAEPRP